MPSSEVHEFVRSAYDADRCEECGGRERQDPHPDDWASFQHREYRRSLENRA